MRLLKLFLLGSLCLLMKPASAQQSIPARKIEQLLSTAIDSAYQASVKIHPYDTLHKQEKDGLFSGVVVSAEGHVLTVAHAAKTDEYYQLSFPNGMKLLAVGLGRIAIKQGKNKGLDLAMLKILKKENFPFAKMGWNNQMINGQPALSISYPGSFVRDQPNVRFGRITDTDSKSGYFTSSCKMEPGDSGGPLFDGNGKVIGLHSWVKASEELNYEVPVDLYRKYWSALNKAIDYKELPAADEVQWNTVTNGLPVLGPVASLVSLPEKLKQKVVQVRSKRGGKEISILGTVIELQKGRLANGLILSKSSMVADSINISLAGKNISATVLARDKENDLVLLSVPVQLDNAIRLKAGAGFINLTQKDLGKFLVTITDGQFNKVGVLSSLYDEMPMRFSVGNFGANARFINQKITITNIAKGSASDGVLKLNDQVSMINGVAISKPAEYGAELQKYLAGDSISISAVRGGSTISFQVYLPAYPRANHVASNYIGGRSARSDGFSKIFLQDAAIKPEECGGPVFDSKGEFYGINIARHSRTTTVVMPVEVISDFLNKSLRITSK